MTKKYPFFLILALLSINFLSLVSSQPTLDAAKKALPDFDIGVGKIMLIFVVVVFSLVFIGVGTYFFIRWLKFDREVVILEDVQGSDDLEPVGKDKAMLVKVGKGGTELLYLKKRKVYRGAYGKRMGKKRYYFAIGGDGYWYNVTLGSLNEGMGKVSIKPTATNMRYQNEALMELIKNRHENATFWQKYGAMVVNIAFFLLVAVMFWLYFDKLSSTAPVVNQAADALKEAAEALSQTVGGLNQLKGSGGLVPA